MLSSVRQTILAARRAYLAADRAGFEVKRRFGFVDPVEVLPYRGHGTPERVHLKGRVLEAKGITRSRDTDTIWRNLTNSTRRFLSDEVPGARVWGRMGGANAQAVSDDEGYFELCFDLSGKRLRAGTSWHPVELELLGPFGRDQNEMRTNGIALVPGSAEYGVISDLDDTVVHSMATNALMMSYILLVNNAHTRLPFPGVASFYHALQDGTEENDPKNPIFYVSSSPWNIYDLIEDFLDVHGVPAGPIFLKDWSPTVLGRHTKHKMGIIRSLLDTYPELPFVLIGDSGQRDPEIYTQVVREYPERIRAVYIRNVTGEERSQTISQLSGELRGAGVELLLARDTAAAADHALDIGLISPAAAERVRQSAPRVR